MCQLVTAIALLVTHTNKLGKCAQVGDCFSSPCIAYRQAWEVCQLVTAIALLETQTSILASWGSVRQLVTAIALLVLHTGQLGKCVRFGDCYSSPCVAYRQAMEVCASW